MQYEQIRVLLAEDDPLAGELIQLRVEQEGIEIIGIAYNGRQAVEMTKNLLPDVLMSSMSTR